MSATFVFTTLMSIASTTPSDSVTIYEQIQQLSKAELHLHLGGSYPLEYLCSIATPEQYAALESGLTQLSGGIEYQKAFFVFGLVSAIVNTEQKIEDGTFALCKALQNDGITYVEIRTGLKNLGGGYEAYLQAVLRGVARATHPNFTARIVLSLQRNSPIIYAEKTIDLALAYRHHGIVGIDISGDSTLGDGKDLLSMLVRAKQAGLALLLHIGESPLETDQLLLLETLQPNRVGHAVHLTPDALAWIKEHKTPIEVCLTSSMLAKMVNHFTEHPGIEHGNNQHPIIICTDDPLIFKTSLTQEFMLLHDAHILDYAGIKRMIETSFNYAILPESSIHLDQEC